MPAKSIEEGIAAYESEVEPLVEALKEKCREVGMPFFLDVQVGQEGGREAVTNAHFLPEYVGDALVLRAAMIFAEDVGESDKRAPSA